METRPPDFPTTLQPTSPRIAELDRLGDEITELSAHLGAATARLLDLIREFDARGGWNTGFRSCAEWLAWRVGLAPGVARERVRVARALGTLPALAEALARGEFSYAKVRALTRVATPETEAREAARQHAGRALHVYEDEDGTVVLRGRLTPEVGALLLRALDAARETLYQRRRAVVPPASDPATGDSDPAAAASGRVGPAGRDGAALRARSRSPGRAGPGGSPRRCRGAGGSGATRPIRAGRGEPCSRGNVPAAGVRREPGGDAARRGGADRGGRSPDAHDSPGAAAGAPASRPELPLPGVHRPVRTGASRAPLGAGGPTTLSNLALLCRRHHRAVHEEGYQLDRGSDGTLHFRRPDGRALPDVPLPAVVPADAVGALGAQHAAKGIRLHARTGLAGWLGERLDVGWAIDVLHPLATRNVRSLPSPDGRGR